jgi:hypothetical protein
MISLLSIPDLSKWVKAVPQLCSRQIELDQSQGLYGHAEHPCHQHRRRALHRRHPAESLYQLPTHLAIRTIGVDREAGLERLEIAPYNPALAMDALRKLQDGSLSLETPRTRAPGPPGLCSIRTSGFTA